MNIKKFENKELYVRKVLVSFIEDVFNFLGRSHQKFDVVFADPPYDLKQFDIIPDLVLERFVVEGGLFVLEHSKERDFRQNPCFTEHRRYGKVNFSFFYKNTVSI